MLPYVVPPRITEHWYYLYKWCNQKLYHVAIFNNIAHACKTTQGQYFDEGVCVFDKILLKSICWLLDSDGLLLSSPATKGTVNDRYCLNRNATASKPKTAVLTMILIWQPITTTTTTTAAATVFSFMTMMIYRSSTRESKTGFISSGLQTFYLHQQHNSVFMHCIDCFL